jgi:NAD(P)-dependent dehydrogenase (short-subunit alcohol dehydrogenase family)
MELRGKTVLITGAARGIGAETARQLAARGARIALVGLEPEELARVAQQCGPDAAWFEADVTDSEALAGVVESVVERFGGIDVVMANAGVAATGFVRSMDPEAFERTIEVNLLGVFRTVRACLPHVIERRGYVLVIASLAAATHGPGMAAYSASKAGAEAFGNSLRAEVAHLGVDVGVGYFAFLDTDMVRGADGHPVFGKLRSEMPKPFGKTYPLSDAVRKVVEGMERRGRTVIFPGWVRPMLLLRGLLAPLLERGSGERTAEIDAAFARDVEERGREAASAHVGPGGQADRGRETAHT